MVKLLGMFKQQEVGFWQEDVAHERNRLTHPPLHDNLIPHCLAFFLATVAPLLGIKSWVFHTYLGKSWVFRPGHTRTASPFEFDGVLFMVTH